jgi:S-DNA-T family DNA segregation ATPase FtsK/SpoIIIE
VAESRPDFIPLATAFYRLPPVSMLKYDDAGAQLDKNAMLEMSARLTQTLSDYGIKGEVQAIRPGPVVTMYEFAPAPGTRVSKIASLDNDIAMRLEAPSVRIVAPIPGKAVHRRRGAQQDARDGVAEGDHHRRRLHQGQVEAGDGAGQGHRGPSGRLRSGQDAAPARRRHHRLGQVGLREHHDRVDPLQRDARRSAHDHGRPQDARALDLRGHPAPALPVVTDPKKANLALRWAVEEMERRYELLAEAGVRDLGTYNRKIEKQLEAAAAAPAEPIEVAVHDETGAEDGSVAGEITDEDSQAEVRQLELRAAAAKPPARKLPFIVVIIDEFADLMMVAPKDIETSVARIAQKARAAGIHLVLATQRPSVDVITGLIKANFPSRIAFKVVQRNDSRTVLDQNGAEALLGQGDMLFSDRGGAPAPRARLPGASTRRSTQSCAS